MTKHLKTTAAICAVMGASLAFAGRSAHSQWRDFQNEIAGTDKIEVFELKKEGSGSIFETGDSKSGFALAKILETDDPKDVSEFLEAVKIEIPKESYTCLCRNNIVVELYKNGKKIAEIANRHSTQIYVSGCGGNAKLENAQKWADWFGERGMDLMRKDLERQAKIAEEDKINKERWESAMPESFKPFWHGKTLQGDYSKKTSFQPISEAVAKEFPDGHARALMLLRWYGSGDGKWSGFPAYESVAGDLLNEIPAEKIAGIAETEDLDEKQLAGAARFFAMTENYPLLSPKTKERLLELSMKGGHDYNIHMAKRAFGKQK